MSKDFRDICLTIGSVGLISVLALFVVTLLTKLKLTKFALILLTVSVVLISIGMSRKNRDRLKGLLFSKA